MKLFSPVKLFATPWTVAYRAPLSMGFSRQAYWSGLPFPSPGNLPDPGINPGSSALQADALPSEPPGKSYPAHVQEERIYKDTITKKVGTILEAAYHLSTTISYSKYILYTFHLLLLQFHILV